MGKLVLIIRMGAKIDEMLPSIVESISYANLNVVWVCDPMHGNTYQTEFKTKTRSV